MAARRILKRPLAGSEVRDRADRYWPPVSQGYKSGKLDLTAQIAPQPTKESSYGVGKIDHDRARIFSVYF